MEGQLWTVSWLPILWLPALVAAALAPLWLPNLFRRSASYLLVQQTAYSGLKAWPALGWNWQKVSRIRRSTSGSKAPASESPLRLTLKASDSKQTTDPVYEELSRCFLPDAGGPSLARVGFLLSVLVQQGFKDPKHVERLCEAGLADVLGRILSLLTRRLLEMRDFSLQLQRRRHGQAASASPQSTAQSEQVVVGQGGIAEAPSAMKDLGTACLQASWLLVQLTAGTDSAKRAVVRGVTPSTLAAFMRSMAPEDLVTCCVYGCGAGPAPSPNTQAPGLISYAGTSSGAPRLAPALRTPRLLPQALLDAVLRNCTWCILQLCDPYSVEAHLQQGRQAPVDSAAAAAEEGSGACHTAAVPVEVGLMLLPAQPPSETELQRGRALSPQHCGAFAAAARATCVGAAPPCAPCDVLVRLVQCWEGLEAALAAGGVLAGLALLADSAPTLAARARAQLLGPHTFGQLCEALCRVGAVDGPTVGGDGSPLPTNPAPASVLSGPVGRPCALLSRFFASALSSPRSASQLLRQAVADHAVSWLLHAQALPLPLRRQLLRQLLGVEGQCVLAAPTEQPVDGPLALCHIISAPTRCHSLLTSDVAGYLLAAASFRLAPAQPLSGHLLPGHQREDHQPGALDQQLGPGPGLVPDPAWEVDAALLGAQALGDGEEQAAHLQAAEGAGQFAAALGAAGAFAAPPGPDAQPDTEAGARSGPAGAGRPLSTLAVACRLLLAGGRLDIAVGAFFADLQASCCAPDRSCGRTPDACSPCTCSDIRSCGEPDSNGHGDWAPSPRAAEMGRGSEEGNGKQSQANDLGPASGLLREGSSVGPSSGGRGAPADLRALPSPLLGTRSTAGLCEDSPVVGYRWFGSGPPSAFRTAAASSGGSSISSLSSSGIVPDVIAGVAGLIDAMVRRSASLGGARGPRGSGVDHADSMSDSLTAATTTVAHGQLNSGPSSGRGSACAPRPDEAPCAPAIDWEDVLVQGGGRSLPMPASSGSQQPLASMCAPISAVQAAKRRRRAVIDVRGGVCGSCPAAVAEGDDGPADMSVSGSSSLGQEADMLSADEEEHGRAELSAASLGPCAAAACSSSCLVSGRSKRVSAPAGSMAMHSPAGPGSAGSLPMPSVAGLGWRPAGLDGAHVPALPGPSAGGGDFARGGSVPCRSAEPAIGVTASNLVCGRLPPYRYFGATRLTAAALAVPPDVAEAAASRLSNSGNGPNGAVREIAVATAAAAAATDTSAHSMSAATPTSASQAPAAALTKAVRTVAGYNTTWDSGAWHAGTAGLRNALQGFNAEADTHVSDTGNALGGPADVTRDYVEGFISTGGASSDGARVLSGLRNNRSEDYSPFSTLAFASAAHDGTFDDCAGMATAPAGDGHPCRHQDGSPTPPLLAGAIGAAQGVGRDSPLAGGAQLPRGTSRGGIWGSTLSSDGPGVVFVFGDEQVEVSTLAFRSLRRCSPLLYGWLSRLPDRSMPISIVQVPGLDDQANSRVFRSLLGWAQGIRDVPLLLCQGGDGGGGGGDEADATDQAMALQQLDHLWRAADYLQVDELLVAAEDELSRRFMEPGPAGLAAWSAALSLAASQQHASGRLAGMCALHFMRHVWAMLADEEARAVAGAAAGVLGPAVAAEVRDRLVALVALSDQDITGGE